MAGRAGAWGAGAVLRTRALDCIRAGSRISGGAGRLWWKRQEHCIVQGRAASYSKADAALPGRGGCRTGCGAVWLAGCGSWRNFKGAVRPQWGCPSWREILPCRIIPPCQKPHAEKSAGRSTHLSAAGVCSGDACADGIQRARGGMPQKPVKAVCRQCPARGFLGRRADSCPCEKLPGVHAGCVSGRGGNVLADGWKRRAAFCISGRHRLGCGYGQLPAESGWKRTEGLRSAAQTGREFSAGIKQAVFGGICVWYTAVLNGKRTRLCRQLSAGTPVARPRKGKEAVGQTACRHAGKGAACGKMGCGKAACANVPDSRKKAGTVF